MNAQIVIGYVLGTLAALAVSVAIQWYAEKWK